MSFGLNRSAPRRSASLRPMPGKLNRNAGSSGSAGAARRGRAGRMASTPKPSTPSACSPTPAGESPPPPEQERLVQERHGDGRADRNKLASERQPAGMGIDLEGRHRVALLIAREEEPPRRVNRETARIVGVAPGFARPGQFAAGAHREPGDGVVPARSRINEPAVRRDRKFRAQVAATEAFG